MILSFLHKLYRICMQLCFTMLSFVLCAFPLRWFFASAMFCYICKRISPKFYDSHIQKAVFCVITRQTNDNRPWKRTPYSGLTTR